jgi:hypothetical protein
VQKHPDTVFERDRTSPNVSSIEIQDGIDRAGIR